MNSQYLSEQNIFSLIDFNIQINLIISTSNSFYFFSLNFSFSKFINIFKLPHIHIYNITDRKIPKQKIYVETMKEYFYVK